MRWLGRRHEGNGAVWVVLLPLLFDIARYLKGYVGGLIVSSIEKLAYRLSRETDDESVSFTVWRLTQVRRQAEMIAHFGG